MLDDALAALHATDLATLLRTGRWAYPIANVLHIAGIGLLLGAILPLDLRLIGLWRSVPASLLARVLVPVAAGGLALALVTGFLLFSVRPAEYAAIDLFAAKLLLIVGAVCNALALRATGAWRRLDCTGAAPVGAAPAGRLRLAGALSILLWVAVLSSGRFLGYV